MRTSIISSCLALGLSAVTVLGLSGCGTTAPTQTAAAPAVAAPSPAKDTARPTAAASKSETICRREVVVGSYFPIRVCKTAEEWERDSRGIERTQDDIARGVGSATPKQ